MGIMERKMETTILLKVYGQGGLVIMKNWKLLCYVRFRASREGDLVSR